MYMKVPLRNFSRTNLLYVYVFRGDSIATLTWLIYIKCKDKCTDFNENSEHILDY